MRKLFTTHPKFKPNYRPWITYDETNILRAGGSVVVCCPVHLISYSAMTRYVIRESGLGEIFRLRPGIGKEMHLVMSPNAPLNNDIFLLFTRASSKHPMLHEVLHLCLTDLVKKFTQAHTIQFRFPIYDRERSVNKLPAWYSMLRDHFIESNIDIVLHDDMVYVSIASVNP